MAARKTATATVRASTARNGVTTRGAQLEHRCQKFVEVAEQLFLERGFAGTSVNEVVRLSGGSLSTLYSQYRNKEELFEAVMHRRASMLFTDIITKLEQRRRPSVDMRAELLDLASMIHSQMLSAGSLAMFRLAVYEGPEFPTVRHATLVSGLDAFLKRLADYFAVLAQDRLNIADPLLAAEEFVSLVQGQQRLIAACGDTARLTKARRQAHVQRVVEVFLRIYPLQAASGSAKPAPRTRTRTKA